MEKFKKLSMLVIGLALLTLTSMSVGYSAVTVTPDASSSPDYYVSKFDSIKEAINWFGNWSPSNPDNTIIVREGTYNEGLMNIFSDKSGLTIQAEPGETAIVNGGFRIGNINDVTIEGLRVNGGAIPAFQLTAGVAHDCSILNNYATSTSIYGVISLFATNVNGTVIDGNVIYSSPGFEDRNGVYYLGASGSISINNNTVHGFTSWEVYFGGASGTITNNLITNAGLNNLGIGGYGSASAAYNAVPPDFYIAATLGPGNFAIDVDDVKYSSTNPAAPDFLYLSCDTPDSVLLGASDGGFIGALPIYGSCCIEGDEALLAACIDGRELVMATPGWDQPRNSGKGKGQGVLLNMPLIAHTATAYVDSLEICNEEDAEELHSCIVSYFASGGKSSHFGE